MYNSTFKLFFFNDGIKVCSLNLYKQILNEQAINSCKCSFLFQKFAKRIMMNLLLNNSFILQYSRYQLIKICASDNVEVLVLWKHQQFNQRLFIYQCFYEEHLSQSFNNIYQTSIRSLFIFELPTFFLVNEIVMFEKYK